MIEIKTGRLLLRSWRDADLDPWAEMNADPEVRAHLGPLLSREQAAASIRYFQEGIDRDGFGFWAVEVLETGEFVGMCGLDAVDEEAPVDGVEIGWRLARSAWGHGYATEAARAVLDYGFDRLGLAEILSITAVGNVRSQAVMRRLGMSAYTEFDDDGVRQVVFRKSP
ncbi:MAG: GNAT family N-acetyltransferase [Hamadaea sp.]|uniref:GNAT family N-acetyltransferase n=1 Tax=Hamadaea sp. TaxID=2024425 RepID=UPI0018143DCF|nr:GNAT family N-acetyltransferase [Hamadaea sp.]NUT21164.1 GNAT family N-acetyltransferase [Hamadaea sp.]